MTMNKPEWVIFDLGRVLVDYDFHRVCQALHRYSTLGEQEIHDFFRATPQWDAFERGRISPEGFFQHLVQELNLTHLSFEEFKPIWNNIFTEKKESVAIVEKLLGRVRLTMLSNVNLLHWEHILDRFPFMAYFENPVASYAVGYRKPEPEIFRYTLRQAGIPADAAVFVDDILAHVTAAQSLGIRAHQFIDAPTLVRDLDGILP
jgi:glucose-1-phosphatase